MNKKNITAILFLIQILFLQKLYGQVSTNMTDQISHKFQNYVASVPREEIYVHSDRDDYISGENVWFNIYLIDRKSLKASSESKIAYFELLNPENRPIVQKRIWLNTGFGPGQIVLPDTLSTGTYTIRAYTSWMKNFLPYNCFTKDIHIYNAFSARVFKQNGNSGQLINGGISTGNFQTKPNSGLTLKTDNLKPDVLEIDVISNDKYRSENSNQFYLFIQAHGNIVSASSQVITAENTKIFIPRNKLESGINQITVFNIKGQPVEERFIYSRGNENPAVAIHSADSSGRRNKVSLDLEFGKEFKSALNSGIFSISVAPETDNHTIPDINDYMVFGSEFGVVHGSLFNGLKISKVATEVIDSVLQNVYSNWINWSDILTNELPELKYQIEKDDHFLTGKLLTPDRKSGDPDKFVLLSPPGKIAVFQYARTDKNGIFSFRIHIDQKVNELIIQPDIITKNQSLIIEPSFSDKYLKLEHSSDSLIKPIPGYISNWSVNHQVSKIYGASSVGNVVPDSFSMPKLKRFYGKPDNELIMKDYITLPVMQEVFFELLAGVSLKTKKSGYEITVANPNNNNKPYETPPGLFIDGVVVKDAGQIASLDPENVEKIDVVRERYSVGDYTFNGIVNIITKTADFSLATLPDYAIRQPYRVIDPVFSFVSPDYSSSTKLKSRVPDFRNTLYWNPAVKADKDGKASVQFWTSDFISDFEINIQGFTPEGKPFTLSKIIKIKR
jgi:hypothetical protein